MNLHGKTTIPMTRKAMTGRLGKSLKKLVKGRTTLQRREDVLMKKEAISGKIEKWGVSAAALSPR
jgi:hypothetical protein